MERSAEAASAVPVVASVSLSLVASRRVLLGATEAVFDRVPAPEVVTTIVIEGVAPTATRSEERRVGKESRLRVPWHGVEETKLTPAGRSSVTETAWASEGAELASESVMVRSGT